MVLVTLPCLAKMNPQAVVREPQISFFESANPISISVLSKNSLSLCYRGRRATLRIDNISERGIRARYGSLTALTININSQRDILPRWLFEEVSPESALICERRSKSGRSRAIKISTETILEKETVDDEESDDRCPVECLTEFAPLADFEDVMQSDDQNPVMDNVIDEYEEYSEVSESFRIGVVPLLEESLATSEEAWTEADYIESNWSRQYGASSRDENMRDSMSYLRVRERAEQSALKTGRRLFSSICLSGLVALPFVVQSCEVLAEEIGTAPKINTKKGRPPSSPYDEDRLLEQNRRMQRLNSAPREFPGFVREGFQVKVITNGKYLTSKTGLIYYDMVVGDGKLPEEGQEVIFHYTGYNESGRRVDSSYQQGKPAKVRLGIKGMIPGFEEGIKSMRPGGRRIIIVPPELGPPVGPSTFFSAKQFEVFDVELLQAKDCSRRTLLFYSDVVCD